MLIILAGKEGSGCEAVAEALKAHWQKIGTTVYVHDAKAPVRLMRDALSVIGAQFALPKEEVSVDAGLMHLLLCWGQTKDLGCWGKIARKKIAEVTGRWSELGLFHVTIVHGLCFKEDLALFPRAYRVYLEASPEKRQKVTGQDFYPGTLSDISLESWARGPFNVFDLALDMDTTEVSAGAEMIAQEVNLRLTEAFKELEAP